MSQVGDAVARRLAEVRATGDASPLAPPEAFTDALALLREATPAPEEAIDFAALGDVCWTLYLRADSGLAATKLEVMTAEAALGFLHGQAPAYVSLPDLPSEMAGDPQWDARFASLVATAHGDFGIESKDLPRPARLSSVEIALAWVEKPRHAFGDDDLTVMYLRMGLLALRAQLAPEPDDLATALAIARTLHDRLDAANPSLTETLQKVYEVLSLAALLLGDPALDEAERVLAAAPAGTITPKTAGYLAKLQVLRAEPDEWPGQADLRVGASMATEGIQSSDDMLLAFGIQRLSTAVPAIPLGHPLGDEAQRLLATALVTYGALREDQQAIAAGALASRLLDDFHARLTAYAVESGVALPPEIELGSILVNIVSASLGVQRTPAGVDSELMARYRTAFARLPTDDPDRDAFAAIAAAPDSGTVTIGMLAVPWARLAVAVRAALPDGQPARTAADTFDSMASAVPTVAEESSALSVLADLQVRDQEDLNTGITRVRAELARANDGEVRETLTGVLTTLLLSRSIQAADHDAADEAIGLLLSADPQKLPSGTRALLGLARLTHPALIGDDVQRLREEAALLASLPQGGGTSLETVFMAGAPYMARVGLLVEDLDVTQIGKIAEMTQRLRDLAGQAGPQATALVESLADFVDIFVQGIPGRLEAVLDGRSADARAALVARIRQQIEALPADDPAREPFGGVLAIALASQAGSETDPARARELLAEAEHLVETVQVPPALAGAKEFLLRASLDHARARIEGAALPPHPLVKDQPDDWMLAASDYSEEAVLGMLRDQRIPAYRRVTDGFAAAFRVLAYPSRVDQAMTYAETALEVLADVTDRGADQRSAELALSVYVRGFPLTFVSGVLGKLLPGPGADTAESERVDRAAMLLERSRGMLLARLMEGHVDLGDLHRVRPDLAREFERLTAQLGAAPDALARLRPKDHPPYSGREEWARLTKRRVSREYEELVTRIREQAGLADFLLAPSADRMRELAAEGPVVMLVYPSVGVPGDAPTELAPYAVVVTADRITPLRIASDSETIADMAARMRSALEVIYATGPDRPGPDDVIAAGQAFREILSWTWHTVVRPVLRVAGIGGPAEGVWPRIWWVPGGPFNALPLHAAECTLPECGLNECGATLDLAVSSYVPGFRVLAHVRAAAAMRRATPRHRTLLVTASPTETTADTMLIGADATQEAVLAAIRNATHIYFGCHASSDPAEPSGSRLHLPSGQQLSVLEICRTRPRSAQLAFLAACGTSRTSQRLADESIHLSSAFLLTGFPEAVGTLWEINSTDAKLITKEFHRSSLPPARALHQAIRKFRNDHPHRPYTWASYVHAGA